VVILELIHANPPTSWKERACLIRTNPRKRYLVSQDKNMDRMPSGGDASVEFLPYQLSTVKYWFTVALTGNGELGFDSGEGA
jgi:hypothetical protein